MVCDCGIAHVHSIDPTSGPAAGGSTITITGTNFGLSSEESNPTATFGGVASPSCTWVSSQQLMCETPAGVGADKALVVTIDGRVGTAMVPNPFSYEGATFVYALSCLRI